MSVLNIAAIGPKEPLPADLVNITDFEWSLSQGYEGEDGKDGSKHDVRDVQRES